MSRFDYVKYDEEAVTTQNNFKQRCEEFERSVHTSLTSPRAKAIIFTKLEEVYMWIGKAIRDDQIMRKSAELQEERTNS